MRLTDYERNVYEHQDRIFGFACYLLGSREDARDVTQEVLIRLWRHGGGLESERLLPWLIRVTRNACIDAIRHRKTVRGVISADKEVDSAADLDASPSENVESQDDRRMVQAALERIQEPYRSVVVLREIQELKYEEISAAMDMPLNTVKVYIHRGRKMLREQLNEVIERERV